MKTLSVFQIGFVVSFVVWSLIFTKEIIAQSTGPVIGPITVQTPGSVEKYAKFEISFPITTQSTNPYVIYDVNPPSGIPKEIGISVDLLITGPGDISKSTPCFYFQPYHRLGEGGNLRPVPTGPAQWRCRIALEKTGIWQYKIRATDKSGTIESATNQFTVIDPSQNSSTRHGFVQNNRSNVSLGSLDSRFFSFSDGTPFAYPYINVEVNSFNTQSGIETQIAQFGQNGIRFVRWFPTSETGRLVLYGGWMDDTWGFDTNSNFDDVDSANGKKFSWSPSVYQGSQTIPAIAGATYAVSFRGHIGSGTLSTKIAFSNGNNKTWSDNAGSSWLSYGANHSYALINSGNAPYVTVSFNASGQARLADVLFQRYETENSSWGPNLLERPDADTYLYVDQVTAARFDKLMSLSEQYGVYHKVPLFWKEDFTLSRLSSNCTVNSNISWLGFDDTTCNGWYQKNFVRYFLARWSYSTALHSLEYANEHDPGAWGNSVTLANYVNSTTARKVLMTNSYYHWGGPINPQAWTNPAIDYADRHWYAVPSGGGDPSATYSNKYNDATAYVRDCLSFFRTYNQTNYVGKPFVQGEGGVMDPSTYGQYNTAYESTGTWFHKMLWSHVGVLGYSCGGEWFPNYSQVFPMYKAYDAYIGSESSLNNNSHVEIGTDLTGNNLITNTNTNLRAFGSKDPVTGRVLVWVDNKNNTWQNPNYNTTTTATFTVSGMPAGSYTRETWDTRAGTFIATPNAVTVSSNGNLVFTASTAKDIAYKFYLPNAQASPTPLSSPKPGDINGDGLVNAIDILKALQEWGTYNALSILQVLSNWGR